MSSRNIRVGIALLGYLFVSISEIHAQSFEEYKRQALSDFNNYKKQQQRDFKEYRDRVNAEFAEYMRRAWPQFDAQPAEPVPDRPEPPRPAVKDPNAGPSNDPIPFDNVIPSPDPVRPPQPVSATGTGTARTAVIRIRVLRHSLYGIARCRPSFHIAKYQ